MDYKSIEGHSKMTFHISMVVIWVLFGLLAVFKLPLLQVTKHCALRPCVEFDRGPRVVAVVRRRMLSSVLRVVTPKPTGPGELGGGGGKRRNSCGLVRNLPCPGHAGACVAAKQDVRWGYA